MTIMTKASSLSHENGRHEGLFIFARFHAREGQEGGVAEALRDEIPLARAEPGCLTIDAYRSSHDPRLFFIYSRWVDEDAFEIHAELPHTVRFLERVQPLIDHKLDVTRTVPLNFKVNPENPTVSYFAVTRERGPAWNMSIPMREQKRWREHAAFMNRLDEEGFIVVGGPVGDGTKLGFSKALFLVKADSATTVEKRLEADPYAQMGMLRTTKIEPWSIPLGNARLNLGK